MLLAAVVVDTEAESWGGIIDGWYHLVSLVLEDDGSCRAAYGWCGAMSQEFAVK